MEIINISDTQSFITKDTSAIREILSPANSSLQHQSLAEARVAPGKITATHYHIRTEEVYYILEGNGRMMLESESQPVKAGDGIVILPGQKHAIENTGEGELVLLCCCTPAYRHDDTVLV